MRAYKALGLFSEDPIEVGNKTIQPRHVFHTLLAPHINEENIKDIAIIRVKAVGRKSGKNTTMLIDLLDYYDDTTGFTAMERLTGWHCAITLGFQVRGEIKPGAMPIEIAISPTKFMEAIQQRNIRYQISYE
jgi:lysine 6-dehydrogenase